MRRPTRGELGILLASTLLVASCGEETTTPPDDGGTTVVEGEIRPTFELGQTWFVGTLYRQQSMRLPEDAVTLTSDPDGAALDDFSPHVPAAIRPPEDELWSSPIYWEFGVINTNYLPDAESSFYALSLDADGAPQPITIIKAIAPKELNGESISEDLDPVFYLVLRESDYRVRGIHYNYRVPEGRNTVVLELPENSTGNPELGADLNYFLVDYYMPVFPLDDAANYTLAYGGQTELEQMNVTRLGDGSVEVTFTSAMDNLPVRQQWDENEPWFTFSATASRLSWRASDDEIAELMEVRGVEFLSSEAFLEPLETIADKFRNRINLAAELRIQPGTYEREAPPAFQPWAGDYWATKAGALVNGFSGRGRAISENSPTRQALRTIRNAQNQTLDEQISALDVELEALQNIDRDATDFDQAAFDTRVRSYYDGRRSIVTQLRNFFENPTTGFVARLRAGSVDLADVNNWSPLDKWGLYLMSQGVARPFEAAIWEAGTQYHPGGPGWWGKCNGWSAAAILFNEPRADLTRDLPLSAINGRSGTLPLTFQTADLKGFLSASNYSGYSVFYGERYNGPNNTQADLHPAVFHRIVTWYIGTEHFPLVFDTTSTEEVWNFPAYRYEMTITAGAQDAANSCQLHHVTTRVRFATDGVSEDHVDGEGAEPEGFWNEYTYDLCTRNGVVQGNGTWTGASVQNHPDFAWVAYQNDARPASAHRSLTTTRRDQMFFGNGAPNENPFLYTDLLNALASPRVNAPQVCNPQPNDCPNGLACDVETGACVAAAPPTAQCSGGSSRTAPTTLTAGTTANQSVCTGRDSWYGVQLAAGDRLTVNVRFTHSAGDIDVALFGPTDAEVGRSDSTSDTETITVTATTAGTYKLRVYGYDNAANSVSIETAITPANPGGGSTGSCGGASDEPNDTSGTATRISSTVTDRAAGVCRAGDQDFYSITLTGNYTARIDFTHSAGDLDIQLLGTNGTTVLGQSAGTGDREEVQGSGPAVLRVYGWNNATGNYRLTVSNR